ncbi:OstA-like protein [Eisenibacter elegans]|uniref:OstA-like protein n=1 Tax=Eisenibacter elegans TaxID=997 RepID=UPI00040BB00D|nr:OstA-like protein [Eisenibacter elegans]
MKHYIVIAFLLAGLCMSSLQAQNIEQLEIIRADELAGGVINQVETRILRGNVIVKHKGMTLYCDSAYQYLQSNTIDVFGHAKLINADGATVTSQKMFYDGNSRLAKAIQNVVLVDQGKTLTTDELDYDMVGKIVQYYAGGKIVDPENVLTSQTGTYDVNSKIYYFTRDVVLVSKKDGERIETDDLKYNTVSNMAYFTGPTKITTKDGAILTATQGTYNTKTKIANFKGRPQVEDKKYILIGDSLHYDDLKEEGFATGDTWLFSKEDSVIVEGDVSQFWGKEGRSLVYGNCLMKQISDGDTLYLKSDTLFSMNNDETEEKYLLAYPKVRIYRNDMQGICDSLVYNRADSMLYFYRQPILWNEKRQMSADSIQLQMANGKVSRVYLKQRSFVITQDTLLNFNQLKGKYITSYLEDNKIRQIHVEGNSESLYFLLGDGDSTLKAIDKALCARSVFLFEEVLKADSTLENKLKYVKRYNEIEAKIIPPHEIEPPLRKLKDFRWVEADRPKRLEMIYRITPSLAAGRTDP